jgi:hypothetical protein
MKDFTLFKNFLLLETPFIRNSNRKLHPNADPVTGCVCFCMLRPICALISSFTKQDFINAYPTEYDRIK